MQGIQFVLNDSGQKTGVLINLKKWGEVWEDFYDVMTAQLRKNEPRESIESVKRRLAGQGKLHV